MDICWEFADSEIFLVDAQALIQLLHEENKETIQVRFIVYKTETFS